MIFPKYQNLNSMYAENHCFIFHTFIDTLILKRKKLEKFYHLIFNPYQYGRSIKKNAL